MVGNILWTGFKASKFGNTKFNPDLKQRASSTAIGNSFIGRNKHDDNRNDCK